MGNLAPIECCQSRFCGTAVGETVKGEAPMFKETYKMNFETD